VLKLLITWLLAYHLLHRHPTLSSWDSLGGPMEIGPMPMPEPSH